MNRPKKRALALLLAAIIICATLPYGAAVSFFGLHLHDSAGYGGDWRCWSQGSSDYSAMSGGCRVVSYSKLIAECGIDSPPDFNPDTFFEWGSENGFWSKTSVYENGTTGIAPVRYAASRGKTLVREGTASLSGTLAQQADTIMSYINKGYYVIATCSSHYVYVGRAASIAAGTPVVMNSGGNVGDSTSLIQQYVSPPNGWSYNYTGILYYSCDAAQDSDVVEFGSYPQSEVTDVALISALNSQTVTYTSYNYYSGNGSVGSMDSGDYMKFADVSLSGEKYRAVTFSACRAKYTTSPESSSHPNGYSANTVYWFKFEPLKWRAVDGSGKLLCESVIDSQPFTNTVYGKSLLYSDSAQTKRSDDYAASSIRKWLNNDFYNTAFSAAEKLSLEAVTVNNSISDKVVLPSADEMKNAMAGTQSKYALIQGFSKSSGQLLRTPGAVADTLCTFGLQDGSVRSYDTSCGIRPIIKLPVVPASSVAFKADCREISLVTGGTKLLSFSVLPASAKDYTVEYSVSNPAVAMVNSFGMLGAVGEGEAEVTVTVRNANGSVVTDTAKLTVKSADEQSTLDFWIKILTFAAKLLLLLLDIFA